MPAIVPHHRAALVEADVVGGDVGRALVAGGVLELHLRELLGDLAPSEFMKPNEVVKISWLPPWSRAGASRARHPALPATFSTIAGLDLVAELALHRLAAEVVLRRSSRNRRSGRHRRSRTLSGSAAERRRGPAAAATPRRRRWLRGSGGGRMRCVIRSVSLVRLVPDQPAGVEWLAEAGGRVEAALPTAAQAISRSTTIGGEIGQHRQELRGHAEADAGCLARRAAGS